MLTRRKFVQSAIASPLALHVQRMFAHRSITSQADVLGSAQAGPIRLDLLRGSDLYSVTLNNVSPDEHGFYLKLPVKLENFAEAVCYATAWWPAGGNRVYPTQIKNPSQVPKGTLFLLVRISEEDYLAVLPMADSECFAWLSGEDQGLFLQLGTFGRTTLDGRKSLFAWSRAKSPYEAIAQAWKKGIDSLTPSTAMLREQKIYPEMFRYLGWCTWVAYGMNVNETNMVQAVEDIERSNIPVRYFLMDEGHANDHSLRADHVKFPNGYRVLTQYRKADKIRWFGLWWAFLGAEHGVKPPPDLGSLLSSMMPTNDGVLVPKPGLRSAELFFEHMMNETRNGGFDFIKVDFMVDALPLYSGKKGTVPTLGGLPPDNEKAIANPYAGAALLMKTCERIAHGALGGIMNCNWHNAACIFHTGSSVVGRCSEDYQSNNLESAKLHLYHAFSSIPWLGQLVWGDHDMFHSSDMAAARPMAISKALSGGPIYLSDEPTKFVQELIDPLCFTDGRLLRPIAPGAPVHDDIFYAPGQEKLLRIVAPLANECAAIGVYHLEAERVLNQALSTHITLEHYKEAASMIQPYPGLWRAPEEGIILYEWDTRHAIALTDRYEISLPGFGVSLLQLSPIRLGWSVIGLIYKYLPAAGISNIKYQPDFIEFQLEEEGPFAVWSEHGVPELDGHALTQIGGFLFLAQIVSSANKRNIRLVLQKR